MVFWPKHIYVQGARSLLFFCNGKRVHQRADSQHNCADVACMARPSPTTDPQPVPHFKQASIEQALVISACTCLAALHGIYSFNCYGPKIALGPDTSQCTWDPVRVWPIRAMLAWTDPRMIKSSLKKVLTEFYFYLSLYHIKNLYELLNHL